MMSKLYSGLLWLMNTSLKQEAELEKAAEYTEAKCGGSVRLIACPMGEEYPVAFRDIPIRPDKRIMKGHVYLVTDVEGE